jgi:tripartite ATP-independent transporter DctM subunit
MQVGGAAVAGVDRGGQPSGAGAAFLARLDHGLGMFAEAAAALIVVVEIFVLSAGVFARYVLGRPFIWSDEFAVILFLWLAMLGSVIALRRGEHMRLSFIVGRMAPATQRRIDGFMLCAMIAFLLAMVPAAFHYTVTEHVEITASLRIPVSYRVGSMAAGFTLMLLTLVVWMLHRMSWREMLGIGSSVVVVALAIWAAGPLFRAMGDYNLIVFFVVFVFACVLLGMPIAFAFGVSTLTYLVVMTKVPITIVMNRLDGGMADLILLSIPLFIFLGALIEKTGLSRALIEFMVSLLGHVRGGLSYVLLCGMYLVSGISGSKAADMAAIAPILLPEMKRRGAREGELISLLSASGAMAETIPPSIILISIGVVTGLSIADLFNGGLVPALVGALALAVVIFFRARKEPHVAVAKAPRSRILRTFIVALPALALPLLIRSFVVNGVATATEVATVGVIYSFLCGFLIYREFPRRELYEMLVKTASLSGALLFIIGMANAMAWALTQSGFASKLEDLMTQIPGGQIGFMAVSIVAFAVLGSVLEGFPAIVLFGPLLFPIAESMGIHQVHYAMVAVLAMSLGLFSPPFGVGFYAACVVGQCQPDAAMRDIWVYMFALLIAVIIIAAVPWLSIGFL